MSDLHQLIHAYLVGTATTQQLNELSRLIHEDETAARTVAEWMLLEADIAESLAATGIPAAQDALGLSGDGTGGAEEAAVRSNEAAMVADDATPPRRLRVWWAIAPIAAAACVALAFALTGPSNTTTTSSDLATNPDATSPDNPNAAAPAPSITLANWRIEPTGDARYTVVAPDRIQLDRGELYIEPTGPHDGTPDAQGLTVITPNGNAHAKGTRFYIGTHADPAPTPQMKAPAMKRRTRVLILSGIVTLINPHGAAEGSANDLLTAEADKTPTKLAVQANSDFAFDLYQQLAKENKGKNLFFSPYSVSGALAMTAEGARQETAAEMGKVLRYPDAAKRIGDDAQRIPWNTSLIHTGMSKLNRKFNGTDDDPAKTAETRAKIVELGKELAAAKANMAQLRADRKWEAWRAAQKKELDVVAKLNAEASKVDQYEIRVANALWGEKTYPFDPNYLKTINTHYDTGGVFPVDFRTNFEAERLNINGWVEDQTNNRIKDLLPKGSLDDTTRLVLTNAIYFKGDWSVPFETKHTQDRDFTLANGDKQQTAIMHAPNLEAARYGAFNADGSHFDTPMQIGRDQDPKGHYPKADGFSIAQLPYKGDDLSMVVIAPNDPTGLAAIEQQLTPDNLNQWIDQLKKRKAHIYLPKFKMETKYTLGDADSPRTLQKMGMVRAFVDPRKPKTGAQFQGMTTSTDPMDQLYISKVFHKAFVEVNEKGTEAAAATAVSMARLASLPLDVPFTPEFKADRPFVFLIRDNQSGTILFLGRVIDPSKLQ